jgi:3',5'-cyclic AMP phosphodiesterase CpdA
LRRQIQQLIHQIGVARHDLDVCLQQQHPPVQPDTTNQALKIIHISDLHCTSSDHTLGQIQNQILHRDYQNSAAKTDLIARFLIQNKQGLGTSVVVMTGDLTDSGDDSDYTHPQRGVIQFINRLKNTGFQVYSIPGNHDYCKEGNQFLTTDEIDRRKRFINYITPQYVNNPKYPHIEDIRDLHGVKARLILLDSMQEELDGNTSNSLAQGTLGKRQLDILDQQVAGFQNDRRAGIKVIVAIHHSPFEEGDELKLSDRSRLLEVIKGRIDCLLFGHVTRDGLYQMPRYTTPSVYDTDSAKLVKAESEYGISLVNCENLEYIGSTFPIALLDLDSRTRSVYYLRPYLLTLIKIVCIEPATSFGDDLEIYVDNNPVTPARLLNLSIRKVSSLKDAVSVDAVESVWDSAQQQVRNVLAGPRDEINIDKDQTYNFGQQFGIAAKTILSFREDSDDAGQVSVDAAAAVGKGIQQLDVKIKQDGRYFLFYSIEELKIEQSASALGFHAIVMPIDINGRWTDGSSRNAVISRVLNSLSIDMSAFHRVAANGTIVDSNTFTVTFPDDRTYMGKLTSSHTISWSNNSVWTKI